jgi:hypothetical protein
VLLKQGQPVVDGGRCQLGRGAFGNRRASTPSRWPTCINDSPLAVQIERSFHRGGVELLVGSESCCPNAGRPHGLSTFVPDGLFSGFGENGASSSANGLIRRYDVRFRCLEKGAEGQLSSDAIVSSVLQIHLDVRTYLYLAILSLICSAGASIARLVLRQQHWWDRENRRLLESKPDDLSWVSFACGIGAVIMVTLWLVKR